jgi:hypothetical protein
MSHPSVMMRMSALRSCGAYRETYPGGEDYELWLRFARGSGEYHEHDVALEP